MNQNVCFNTVSYFKVKCVNYSLNLRFCSFKKLLNPLRIRKKNCQTDRDITKRLRLNYIFRTFLQILTWHLSEVL